MIVDVEATRAIRQAEVGAARTMLERTEDRFGLKPEYLTADRAYGSAENLAWLVKQKKITPHIPVFDKSARTDGTFSRADFTFDPEADRYTCPAGKELVQFRRTYATPRTGIDAEGTRLYRASKKDCDACELKARCCPNAAARKIPRDLMKKPATLPGHSPRRLNMKWLVAVGRKSRCCSPISSASCASGACGCVVHAARKTNSCSPRPRKICGGSPD